MSTQVRLSDSGSLDAMKWRCIGPARGGRVVAVAGDPDDPMTFYFGACAGGIWKTVDGGIYWRCISDGFLSSAAIGAIAVSRSDANVVYAGTGGDLGIRFTQLTPETKALVLDYVTKFKEAEAY